jgi:hypothetical protein
MHAGWDAAVIQPAWMEQTQRRGYSQTRQRASSNGGQSQRHTCVSHRENRKLGVIDPCCHSKTSARLSNLIFCHTPVSSSSRQLLPVDCPDLFLAADTQTPQPRMDCIPVPIVCFQCGTDQNPCHCKVVGPTIGFLVTVGMAVRSYPSRLAFQWGRTARRPRHRC